MVTLVVLLLLPLVDVQSKLLHSHALLLFGLLLVEVICRQVGGERHVQDLILFRRMKDSSAGQRRFSQVHIPIIQQHCLKLSFCLKL